MPLHSIIASCIKLYDTFSIDTFSIAKFVQRLRASSVRCMTHFLLLGLFLQASLSGLCVLWYISCHHMVYGHYIPGNQLMLETKKGVTQTQQQKPESLTVTLSLTWHLSNTRFINFPGGTSSYIYVHVCMYTGCINIKIDYIYICVWFKMVL